MHATSHPHQVQSNSGDVILAPLRPASVFGNREVFRVGDEVLFSNDELLLPREPFPGSRLPDQKRTRFPIPDRPGEYCESFEEFKKLPKFLAQWVHWPEHFDLVLAGRYHDVRPVHFEGIFTLVCNFMCPHCSRRVTRSRWVEGGTWENNSEIDKRNTMHPADLKRVIDQLSGFRQDRQLGIVWGGGDPTASPFTYDAMAYARSMGITGSFLTNGVFLDVNRALDADPILIRVSLNCGSEETYRKFHGYPKGWDYFDRVRRNLRELARRKRDRNSHTLIGISLIVDERNLEDLTSAAEEIRRIVQDAGPGIDYVIVRPVFNYAHFDKPWARVETQTKARVLAQMDAENGVQNILSDLGIPLVKVKDSFEDKPTEEFYSQFGNCACLSYGVTSEIRHNGDVQLCSDSYGNPEYTIGNLLSEDLKTIWKSEQRRKVLDKINDRKCWRSTCPHNSRGHHFNRLFHRIEAMRAQGKLEDVRQWAENLRQTTYPLGHSFFI